jgi:hypothetical protein
MLEIGFGEIHIFKLYLPEIAVGSGDKITHSKRDKI